MKRQNDLYSAVCKADNIFDMTNKVCGKVRNKRKVNLFETYKSEHLFNIKKRLDERFLNFGKYNIFMITEPKCRIIMAQEIEDKIINHLIAEYILVHVFENKYVNSMCATRKEKGTLYGIKMLQKYINKLKRKKDNIYVLKLDISKYFYNIDHAILKKILRKNIKDKEALDVLYSIINSTNDSYVNENIEKLKENRIIRLRKSDLINKEQLIDEVKNIPKYKYGKGVALGNQTSQAFGLIYLYEFNHYLKEVLHLKYVVNYMDDFIILHHDKKYLQSCLVKIVDILNNKYKLKVNLKKTKVDNIKNGIDFLGYRFLIKNEKLILKLRKNTKKKFKKKIKKINILYNSKTINKNEYKYLLSSYKGVLKWGNCKDLYYKWVNKDVLC